VTTLKTTTTTTTTTTTAPDYLSNIVEVDGRTYGLVVAQRGAVNDDAAGLFDGGPIASELLGADLEVLQVLDARLFQLLSDARQFYAHDPRDGDHTRRPFLTTIFQIFLSARRG